jgi:hypothetical protein
VAFKKKKPCPAMALVWGGVCQNAHRYLRRGHF